MKSSIFSPTFCIKLKSTRFLHNILRNWLVVHAEKQFCCTVAVYKSISPCFFLRCCSVQINYVINKTMTKVSSFHSASIIEKMPKLLKLMLRLKRQIILSSNYMSLFFVFIFKLGIKLIFRPLSERKFQGCKPRPARGI